MTKALGRRLLRMLFMLVLLACTAFAILADRLLCERTATLAVEQAQFMVNTLTPGPNGDLSQAVKRLRSNNSRIIAVATLDPLGNPQSVYPDSPSHRTTVQTVIDSAMENATDDGKLSPCSLMNITDPENEQSIEISGAIVNSGGAVGPTAQKVLIVSKHESHFESWRSAVVQFAAIISIFALLGCGFVKLWFDRRIAEPLRDMATQVSNPFVPLTHLPTLEAGKWRETAHIAHQYEVLIQRAAHSDIEKRKLELDAERMMRNQEEGFDRKLRRVQDQATTDQLTGLKNRSFLKEKLEPIFDHQLRLKEDLAVIMIDLDNFKRHNDKNGHQAGDALLQFIGSLLRGALRPTDHAVRYGGDEFLLLLPDTTAHQASMIADRIVKLFAQYTQRLGRNSKLSMSAGVASIAADNCESGDELIARCDAAMYNAKRMGKNRIATNCAI